MEKRELTTKQSVRSQYLSRRNSLSFSERSLKSKQIWECLKQEPEFQNVGAVLVYMDYRSEVMTTGLVEELLADGKKRVFAPKVEGMDIFFYEIKSIKDLQDGYQGIREPKAQENKLYTMEIMNEVNSLILVPGAVFDRQRGRMGYGKGFYDRFFSVYNRMYKIALAFDCQIAKSIPMEEHDIKPDLIITESGIIR